MSAKEELFLDFVAVSELARELHLHPRTLLRWSNQPDGFPITRIGKTNFIHKPTAREWMLSRVRKSNPRREARSIPRS